MANRQLSPAELAKANKLLASVRRRLLTLSDGNKHLLFAYRRKMFKELMHDERGKPMVRRRLKALKWAEQKGKCPLCRKALPTTYAVLDRLKAVDGYTAKNTRLIHMDCDTQTQRTRRYA